MRALAALLLLAGAPAGAQGLADAAHAEAPTFAQQIDADADGGITPAEIGAFGEQVFAAIDADGDAALRLDELRAYNSGMKDIAAFRDRRQGDDTAVAIAFYPFDRDEDAAIGAPEHARAMQDADGDGDGVPTIRGDLDGVIFNIAMRNALDE